MKSLPRVRMGEIGLPASSARAFLREATDIGLHSFILARSGRVAAEGYWRPFRPEYAHMLHSLSKSFTSTAFGFAVQEGLASLDDRVVDFFPEYLPSEPCGNMKKMTVRNLLTMNTGHTTEPGVIDPGGATDWVEKFLHSYVERTPGTHFLYNTAASYMVSAIVQRLTGQTVCDYLKPRLFDPLGFGEYWWDTCPRGISMGGFGFNVCTEDLAKFGTFLLNRGSFDGQQLLSPEWIDMATSYQVPNNPEASADWRAGYGFQFWMCSRPGTFRGDGSRGQLVVVCRPKGLVFAGTACCRNFQELLDAIYRYLFDPVTDECLSPSPEEDAYLEDAAALARPAPRGADSSDGFESADGHTYVFAPNAYHLRSLSLSFGKSADRLTMETDDGLFTIPVGHGVFLDGKIPAPPQANVHAPFFHNVAAAGAPDAGLYRLHLIYPRTSISDRLELRFSRHGVRVHILRDGSFDFGTLDIAGMRV